MDDPRAIRWLAATLLVVAACSGDSGGGGGGPSEPPSRQLSLTALPDAIGVFGASSLLATASEGTNPVPTGTVIEFTTTFGQLESATAGTAIDGGAVTRLLGTGTAGQATVTARIAGSAVTATAVVAIGQGVTITVTAQPPLIGPTDVAGLEILVENNDGSLLAAGTRVRVETTLGRLTDNNPATNAFGVARTSLRATGQSGTAVVTATLQGTVFEGVGEVEIGEGRFVTVSADPSIIASNGTTTVTAEVSNFDGSLADRVLVGYATVRGRLRRAQARTDARGLASVALDGDGAMGVAEVRAFADQAEPASTLVEIGLGTNVTLEASPAEIETGDSAQITALVRNAAGAPIGGARVQLSTDFGSLDDEVPATDGGGAAVTVFRAPGVEGVARIRARVVGTDATASVEVVVSDL